MNAYAQMSNQAQAEMNALIDSLPVVFAFSPDQLKAAREAKGIADDVKLVHAGAGLFGTREALACLEEAAQERTRRIVERVRADEEFAYSAFVYEMGNHEYGINMDPDHDVLEAVYGVDLEADQPISHYIETLAMSMSERRAYGRARADYLEESESF